MNKQFRTNISLSLMMFMQYFLVAVWWVPYAAYLTNAEVSGSIKALALSAMAIGFMTSSIVGAYADRYFSAQKILAFSNLISSILLAFAGFVHHTPAVIVFIFLTMLFYMPTWSLTGTIALKHTQQELFPRIRLFGTLGWVASGLFSLVFVRIFHVGTFDGASLPFLCGSGTALLAAILNLTLPDTPPSGKKDKISIPNLLGFKAFVLFRDRSFLVFFLCTFASVLGYALYYTFGAMFFYERHFEYITVTMNWGQVGELFFLFITTTVISKFGFRKAMIFGLTAMVVRYAMFWWGNVSDISAFYIFGILLHGIIFGLFFVAGQIYTDKKSPDALRAQTQGLLATLVWGVALLMGNFICSSLISANKIIDSSGAITYNWSVIFGIVTVYSAIVLIFFIVFYKQEKTLN